MKKFLAVMLMVMLTLTMAVPALAEETGTISVTDTVKDQTYAIYQMATLDSYNAALGAYLYTPVAEWEAFFTAQSDYFSINEDGNIIREAEPTATQAAALAQAALAYAADNGIDATASKKSAADDETVVFDNLGLGYYLVDSSLGAFCGLTTTKPTAEVKEKNEKPEIDKEVQEDSDNAWGNENDADMFQTINYRTTVTVRTGAMNYVLHDKMDAGLTFIEILSVQVNDVDVAAANYTVTVNNEDDCTFQIAFDNDYIATLANNTEIVVCYTAKLNKNAVIAGNGNVNETWLEYADNNFTTHDKVTTYTFAFDIVKTDAQNVLLDGAEFKIYDSSTGGNEVKVVLMDDGITYRRAAEDEEGVAIKVVDGLVRVIGFDSGTYYLEETVAPSGYNKLTARQEFTITDSNLDHILNADDTYSNGGVKVVNKTGAELPETGGFGTTLFIVIGGIVVLMAGVLLFAKKRMSQVAE